MHTIRSTCSKWNEGEPAIKVSFLQAHLYRIMMKHIETCGKYTIKKQAHHVSTYAYFIVSHNPCDPQTNYQVNVYRGNDAIKHFWSSIEEEIREIGRIYNSSKPMIITNKQDENFKLAIEHTCHICHKSIPKNDAVRDHCHLTGKYRGPAHKLCMQHIIYITQFCSNHVPQWKWI